MRMMEQINKKKVAIRKEPGNRKEHISKKRTISVILVVLALFLFGIAVGIMIHNGSDTTSSVIAPPYAIFASSGLWKENYNDLYNLTMITTYFEANWTYSSTNGSWIYGYTIYWAYSKPWYSAVAAVQMDSPQWAANTAPNTYIAYGNGKYTIDLYFTQLQQGFYSQWTAPPNSYGTGSFNAGFGNVNYGDIVY